ncbi:hypothetical protein AVEN_87469-1 [Araneus ventricosus]|uniref:Uncharacterized protein n=1 Tax=Araneus ventricosus TaxID=182803 RepID=A0A4Y2SDK8_ARAVE|nr:hypothetical protein AVEN_87469-1 [Araneus ventricosus]
MWACFTLNHTKGTNRPPAGAVRKFGDGVPAQNFWRGSYNNKPALRSHDFVALFHQSTTNNVSRLAHSAAIHQRLAALSDLSLRGLIDSALLLQQITPAVVQQMEQQSGSAREADRRRPWTDSWRGNWSQLSEPGEHLLLHRS